MTGRVALVTGANQGVGSQVFTRWENSTIPW